MTTEVASAYLHFKLLPSGVLGNHFPTVPTCKDKICSNLGAGLVASCSFACKFTECLQAPIRLFRDAYFVLGNH